MTDRYLETVKLRWAGVEDTLRAAGVALEKCYIYEQGDFLPESGYAGAKKLLNHSPPPTAIFAFNDLMAYGVLHYAHTHGLHVPDQLSVIGFDDILISAHTVPSLSTVAQPKYELGQKVATFLLRRIQKSEEPIEKIILPTKLIVRASTGPPVEQSTSV